MTKELIDLAWRCLPKEFKEEVKELYEHENEVIVPISGVTTLNKIFGYHNPTSDAEGEEMLYCDKSVVQSMAKSAIHSIQIHDYKGNTIASQNMATFNRGMMCALETLFGSKCLPDEKINPESLVTTIKDSMEHPLPDKILLDGIAEPKPAEPKFKVGDEVVWDKRIIAHVDEILNDGDYIIYSRIGKRHIVHESDLEPYTEPEEDLIPSNSGEFKSQVTDNQPRNLSKNIENFDKPICNRLQIAAMAMQGILANGSLLPDPKLMENEVIESVASLSVRLADTLIAEAAKNGGIK